MNKQQIIQKLSFIATSSENAEAVRSSLFRFMAELTMEGVTEEKTYNTRLFPNDVRREIIIRDHFTCAYCNRHGEIDIDPDGELWTIDHVIPFSKGGITCASNGVLSCWRCNSEKRDMTPAEYIRWLRFLSVATPRDDLAEGKPMVDTELISETTACDAVTGNGKIIPPSAIEIFMNTGSWDSIAASFKVLYPQGGVSDLARIMAGITNDGRGYKNFKSTAAKYFGGQ